MKMQYKIILIVLLLGQLINISATNPVSDNIISTSSTLYHSPIIITSDNDLVSQAINEGWDLNGVRDGTEKFPFVISGYNLSSIAINGTRLFLEISNNIIGNQSDFSSQSRMIISNVSNTLITDNIIGHNAQNGIIIDQSDNITINNNRITLLDNGIIVTASVNILIRNNYLTMINVNPISNNSFDLQNVNITIYQNQIYLAGSDGIVSKGYGVDILENSIEEVGNTGISVEGINNRIWRNLINNTFVNSGNLESGSGIFVSSSIMPTDNNEIILNKIINNENYGIVIYDGIHSITNNYILKNGLLTSSSGIYLGTGGNKVYSNNIEKNGGDGVTVMGTNNYISANLFYKNNVGVRVLSGAQYTSTWFNNFINNTLYQAVDEAAPFSSSNVFQNNFYNDHPLTTPFDLFDSQSYLIAGSASNDDPFPITSVYDFNSFNFISPTASYQAAESILISWTPTGNMYSNIINYQLYYKMDDDIFWKQLTNTMNTQFIWNTTLVPVSDNVRLMLIANSSDGKIIFIYSDVFSIVPLLPMAPKQLTGSLSNQSIDLNWNAPDFNGKDKVRYNIYRRTQNTSYTLLTTTSDIQFTDQSINLDLTKTYFYQVSAFNSAGESSFSNEIQLNDTSLPTFTVIGLENGITQWSGDIVFGITPEDDNGIDRVEVYFESGLLDTLYAEPYTVSFDTSSIPNGNYTIDIKVYDLAENMASATYLVNISNSIVTETTTTIYDVKTETTTASATTSTLTITDTVSETTTITKNETESNALTNTAIFTVSENPPSPLPILTFIIAIPMMVITAIIRKKSKS